jgi:molybdenum cofactor cytidylyltransferase
MGAVRSSIGGLVLAAGAGRRFGGGKLVAKLAGRPLVEHAIEAMLGVPAIERIVVVLGADAGDIAARADLGRVETVVCEGWREGIAASLRAGVDALSGCEAIVVTLGDQPFITPQAITALLDELDAPEPAARATYKGGPGHPVLIKRSLFDAVRALRGDTGARDLLVAAGARQVEIAHLCPPDDIDTRRDLESARKRSADIGRD